MKILFAKDGVITNIAMAAEPDAEAEIAWLVPDNTTLRPGDVFDPTEPKVEAIDRTVYQLIFELANTTRQLTRALRATSTAANNAATAAGLPTTANSQDVTVQQFRNYVKARVT